jgi:hypothetical protein
MSFRINLRMVQINRPLTTAQKAIVIAAIKDIDIAKSRDTSADPISNMTRNPMWPTPPSMHQTVAKPMIPRNSFLAQL